MADLDRRHLLLLGGAALLAGCTAGPRAAVAPAPRASEPATPPTNPAMPTASPAPLPRFPRWHPDPRDVEPAAKASAVRAVERRAGRGGSALQVVDAQYGGILPGSACVLVVCRTWARGPGGVLRAGGATYDVRLVRSGTTWRVTAVHPSHPGPPAHPLTVKARQVLAEQRIELPPAAHADVRSGRVHDSVLGAMLSLARTYRLGVSVVRSGHPTYVFGTGRLSDHPRGRAFDTWRIDGHPVVDRRTPRRLVEGFMEAAATAGAYNVGGPYLLGSPPRFFSDDTHHDHVHAGFAT